MSTSVLSGITLPPTWTWRSFWSIVERTRDTGTPEDAPLSVYLRDGVVPRSSRDDNHNRLGDDLSRYLAVRPGDLVFNKLRAWQGGLGVSSHSGIVSPAYYVCRTGPECDPRYLHYLLRSAPYLAELTRISKWMPPSQFDLPWEMLRRLPVALPSIKEQRRIVDFLDVETARIDAIAAVQQQMKLMLQERRSAHATAQISGSDYAIRRPSRLAWLDSLPEHWQEVRVGLLAHMGSGHTPSRSRPDWWVNCTIPWITTGEVSQVRDDRREIITNTREKISEVGLANSAAELCPPGTVVLCRTASAGYSAVMGTAMATSQDFVTWTCGARLDPYYLLWCLRAMRDDLQGRLATGSTHLTIYVPDLQMLRIPLPELKEQQTIVERIRQENARVDRLVDAVDRQLELLAERRQALITAAVTGQIDVTTASGSAMRRR